MPEKDVSTIDVESIPQTAKSGRARKSKRGRGKSGSSRSGTKRKSARTSKHVESDDEGSRTRTVRPYPASSFTDALTLGEAVMKFAAGDKVRRLTLLEKMNKSPNSSATKMMITNSGKYGITKGSYSAEYIELTEKGYIAVDSARSEQERRQSAFDLAIDGVAPFKALYDHYKSKRLPEREVMKDMLKDSGIDVPDLDECVDTFIVNVKDLELLRTIGGAETLVAIEQIIDEIPRADSILTSSRTPLSSSTIDRTVPSKDTPVNWQKICFYITPIGMDGSDERKHSDLFMSSLVQPALEELGLTVVRADQIGEPGMITTQVLEYLKCSKLAIADLSYLNPNVFYEVALRHALRLPVVQLIRKADRLPFDVNQSRTLTFDTTDIYSLIPKLQTYRAEIANQARKALEDPESVGNPVSVFYPDFYK
jgi:hypothetical protein